MRHIFDSIAYPDKYCYIFNSGYSDNGPNRCHLNGHFLFYETMGDGKIAHTPDHPISVTLLTDYLYSLAQAMLKDEAVVDAVMHDLKPQVYDDAIEFAEKLWYKEDKTRYYSVQKRKVSASDSKRHDKRYHEITSIHDGSVNAIFSSLSLDYYSGWQSYMLMYSIIDWFRRRNTYMGKTLDFLKWNVSGQGLSSEELDGAYSTCLDIVKASDLIAGAKRRLKHYTAKAKAEEYLTENPSEAEV